MVVSQPCISDSVSHSLLNNACEHPCGARSSALCPPGALALSSLCFFLKIPYTFLLAAYCPAPLLFLLLFLFFVNLYMVTGFAPEIPKQIRQTLLFMQVLARSSPTDKFNLVKLLKKQGEIVAVTGMLFCWWTCNRYQ